MRSIVLCPNSRRDVGHIVTERVAEIARAAGFSVRVFPMFDDDTAQAELDAPAEVEAWLREAELIIALGGDGTMLRTARLAINTSVPILGINMGGKGFLAEVEQSQLDKLPELLRDGLECEERLTLDVEVVRDGKTVHRDVAINDVVLSGGGKVIDLTVFGDGLRISRFSGDGVIIATPTGSTAYSMAAGGPIVEPGAQNILVTPICAHVLEAKPYVLVSDRHVTVEIGLGKRNATYMTVDGNDRYDIIHGDSLLIRKSEKTACFAHVPNTSFYKRVSEKLGDIQ